MIKPYIPITRSGLYIVSSEDSINITPDKSLIQKLGLTGYRTEQAIAELVDNSIDARIDDKELIEVVIDSKQSKISVTDNGVGMNKQVLNMAFTIAASQKGAQKELGRFGLGMKGASSSLGKDLTIITSTVYEKSEYILKYDEDKWLSDISLNWESYPIEKRPKQGNWHGTRIIIGKLKVPLYPNLITNIRKSFGIRYAPFIEKGIIDLYINGKRCEPATFQLKEGSKRNLDIRLPSGNRIRGWIGLLEKASVKGNYGLQIYKHGRLIRSFDKFGIALHPTVAKVIGEIHLDHVPVNFHKTGFIEESPEYLEALEAVSSDPQVRQVIREAEQPKSQPASIEALVDYFSSSKKPSTYLEGRLSTKRSSEVLKTQTYRGNIRGRDIEVLITDGDYDGLYKTENVAGTEKITINRLHPAFKYIKNPLVLIGLILAEAEVIMKYPHLSEAINDRNKRYTNFIRDWSKPNIGTSSQEAKTHFIPNYGLSPELNELYDLIQERFANKFQFTGLSTLYAYLQHAHNRLFFTVLVEKGSAQTFHDLFAKHTGDLVITKDPSKEQLEAIIDATNSQNIVIIRESVEIIGGNIAPPEKAWVDFYFEVMHNKLPIAQAELDYTLRNMKKFHIVDYSKILRYADRRKLTPEIHRLLAK